MKRHLIITLLLAAGMQVGHTQGAEIVIGKVDIVYSNILKEKRAIWVYVPETNDKAQRFPVLYLLDAEEHFHSAVAIAKQLSGVLPDMIIVGITNTVRNRDLTPTHVKADAYVNEGYARVSGGGEDFLKFMRDELMPHVNATYPASSYKMFSGHSLGGLAVVNAFLHHNNMFNAYIALDPSLWWDNKKLVKDAQAILPAAKLSNKVLFVAIANNIPDGLDTLTVQNDTLNPNTILTRSVLSFVHAVGNANNIGLRWSDKFFPGERHGTVELLAEYDALHFVFDYYNFSTRPFTENPNLNIDSMVIAHYNLVSKNLGYKILPGEDMINELGYACMGNNKMNKAYTFFKMNTDNYPTSANAFDSIGEYYENIGNKKMAIESYEKSLSLHETEDTRRKLNELRKK